MFSCSIPTPQDHDPRNLQDEGFWQRFQRWFLPHPHNLQPGGRRPPKRSWLGRGQKLLNKVLSSISLKERQEHQAASRCHCWSKAQKQSDKIVVKTDVGWRAQVDMVQKLVDHLVPALLGFEPDFVPNFLSSYRAFTTPQQVLDLFLARFPWFNPASDGIFLNTVKQAIASILNTWLQQYPQDFMQPPRYLTLNVLLEHVQLHLPGCGLEELVQDLLRQLKQLELAEAGLQEESPELAPPPCQLQFRTRNTHAPQFWRALRSRSSQQLPLWLEARSPRKLPPLRL
ncbi:ral guanine nucleotide dissociation stimulator-like isoform X1 [Ochotona princeps]|uniref:ral guanine nucleotide dissociation stimulator-like isoform X1 n=1 Tax=Ochotona princeps TaxID=9978 RepID=UPI0027155569|nr:ral guanine nucleotide dissociation stimulator-like isoform X1 [Ochotona princeps]